ncbi:Cys-tRNA(Pro) deacylase [Shewanella intestini]|uniref:Cys-tRNA(Pro)/Cys-tRNA(Cys) deacylase n=1 Tax=Shewanella intestini TaxID=2017544 RepID=A0ABS5I379_9GAMM|nr:MULTISPECIES: Cys-tRNA(Pro) deacylase [Shewanella]MBR9728479.1 Cys-tRNA(Pro) deacylase [Shewanella intestini]MRG36298.1 Cys-tRNA(Pro) deacylase [Shewanella sp. XMDDZSB0408]
MTPAIIAAKRSKIAFTIHEYQHDTQAQSYGLEAAEKLGVNPQQVFKTLVVKTDTQQLVVAIVPVSSSLNLKRIAKAVGVKKVQMAEPAQVERTTGYVLGGVSPLGQKKRLTTVIDDSAEPFATMHVSAGRRGLEIELAPQDLATLTQAKFAPIQAD